MKFRFRHPFLFDVLKAGEEGGWLFSTSPTHPISYVYPTHHRPRGREGTSLDQRGKFPFSFRRVEMVRSIRFPFSISPLANLGCFTTRSFRQFFVAADSLDIEKWASYWKKGSCRLLFRSRSFPIKYLTLVVVRSQTDSSSLGTCPSFSPAPISSLLSEES